jgi:hypothetical protein
MQARGTKRKKESDRQRRREAKAGVAAERKAAKLRAIELGVFKPGTGPEMGEPQPPVDPSLPRAK